MNRTAALLLGLGGAAALYYYLNQQQVTGLVRSGGEDVMAALSGWQNVGQGLTWVPYINSVELQYSIPTNLLARIAYEESRFRQDIIDGATPSSEGALGLMQLEPEYFSSVNVPRPFTAADTRAQVLQAAHLLAQLFAHFSDWTLAIAAYNDGQGNIDAYLAGTRTLPAATVTYVANVTSDVPVGAGVLA